MSVDWIIILFQRLDAKPRFLISLFVASVVYPIIPHRLEFVTRIVITWNAGTICFLSLVLVMMSRASVPKMRSYARARDESRWIILFAVVAAACISLLAIALMLSSTGNSLNEKSLLHITLALLTIFASWSLIHTMFALHYAHLYYQDDSYSHSNLIAPLAFPTELHPDYGDFLYFAFGIGMSSQVADVQINSRSIRRFALVHQVLAFFFNTLILALAVNIVASSI